jgi:hypothetical protein
MKNNNQNSTVSIKCTFSNEVHKILEPNYNIKVSERWKHLGKKKLTDAQKIEAFDKILAIHDELSPFLSKYRFEKREKKRVNEARVKRGYVPKKKVKKEDYLKGLDKVAA